jgi:hypothetical protein
MELKCAQRTTRRLLSNFAISTHPTALVATITYPKTDTPPLANPVLKDASVFAAPYVKRKQGCYLILAEIQWRQGIRLLYPAF